MAASLPASLMRTAPTSSAIFINHVISRDVCVASPGTGDIIIVINCKTSY